jgi:hypothetical protein
MMECEHRRWLRRHTCGVGFVGAAAQVPASQPVLMEYTPTAGALAKTMRLLVPKPAEGAPPLPTNSQVELNVRGQLRPTRTMLIDLDVLPQPALQPTNVHSRHLVANPETRLLLPLNRA